MEIAVLAEEIIQEAKILNSSDIYLLPKKEEIECSFRIAGKRKVRSYHSLMEGSQLIRHFKFLAHMDIAEKRKPQLGACTLTFQQQSYRLRLSSVGDYLGSESLVIRFFQKTQQEQKYLFFKPSSGNMQIEKRGLHLFVGPTGSGKTTLMYTLAKNPQLFPQVITIEDPVEIEEQDFLQLQTNDKIQLTYEALIKVCLRHRPDCLIIGEIRDEETATMALRAALTGHVVFATLHANTLPEIYQRLKELTLTKEQIDTVLKTVFFQRMLPDATSEKEWCLVSMYPKTSWNHQLRKAFAYGYITKETYLKEQEKE